MIVFVTSFTLTLDFSHQLRSPFFDNNNLLLYSNYMQESLSGYKRIGIYFILRTMINRNHHINSSNKLFQLDKEYKIRIEPINSYIKFCINN